MNIFKMMIIDMKRCRFQLYLILLFFFIAVFFINSGMNGILYLTFAMIILSSQPFLYEQRSEAGFLYMLPITKQERVAGRYCFGMFLMLLMIAESIFLNILKNITSGSSIEHLVLQLGIFFGIGTGTIALQYILFYSIGKINSQQFIGIIMMAPGFFVFFIANYLAERIDGTLILMQILENINLVSIGTAAAGILLWMISMIISMEINNRKDSF